MEVETTFSEKQKIRNGSFRVYKTYNNDDVIEKKLITVQMLTQNDYADGWRQVVPRAKSYSKRFVDNEGNEIIKYYSNVYKMKVNLAQLPEYLWHRMQYSEGNNKVVNNGYHYYTVEASAVDDEIRELANILKNPSQPELKEKVYELLNILKDNDVYGWVVIRAKSMYH
jgi:hypothetical protein